MGRDMDVVKSELRGPAALVMAPFNPDLSLNVEALEANIRYMLDRGLRTGQGFVICPCGTGEYLALSQEEHQLMVRAAVEVTDGRLPVVAGVGGVNLEEVVQRARNAQAVGARYTMIAPPFYDAIDQDGIYEWYRLLSGSLDMGIVVYDQSWRVGLGTQLGMPLIERLAGLDNVVSLKYGSPNIMEDTVVALERFSDRFAFIDNSLAYTAGLSHMHGATGFISGPSTWWPEFELQFFRMLEEGEYRDADRWHARIAPYMAWFHGEFWSAPRFFHGAAIIKASMEYVGLYGGPLRPPFRAMTDEEKQDLYAVMGSMGVKEGAFATTPVD